MAKVRVSYVYLIKFGAGELRVSNLKELWYAIQLVCKNGGVATISRVEVK